MEAGAADRGPGTSPASLAWAVTVYVVPPVIPLLAMMLPVALTVIGPVVPLYVMTLLPGIEPHTWRTERTKDSLNTRKQIKNGNRCRNA